MKDSVITIRINDIDKEKLKAIAFKKDIPVSQIIREAVKNYLKEVEE